MQSVSYTHLDVYKRQGMICSMVCIELAALTYHSYSPMESGMMKLFRNSSDIDEKISIQSSAMLKNIDDDHVYRTKIMAENYENKMEEANAGLRTGSYTCLLYTSRCV